MRRSHILAVASVREGWGLVVTEANSQGTPAVVYNIHGLRDSVKSKVTGLVTDKNSPKNLASNICMLLNDNDLYNKLQKNAWEWSKKITFEESYKQFNLIIK